MAGHIASEKKAASPRERAAAINHRVDDSQHRKPYGIKRRTYTKSGDYS
jgi:hypothetical protein